MADNLKVLGSVYPNVNGIIVAGYENAEDYLRIFDVDYSAVTGLIASNTELTDVTYIHFTGESKTSSDLILSDGTVTVPAGVYAYGAEASFSKYDGTVV